ncbi:MAG: hypothetical protein ABJB33_01250 [Gemmatimonadota bacterium]
MSDFLTLRLPRHTRLAVDAAASGGGITRSEFVRRALGRAAQVELTRLAAGAGAA